MNTVTKEKRHFFDKVHSFINNKVKSSLWLKPVLGAVFIMFLFLAVYIANNIVAKNLRATFPERQKLFESYYENIYEPKYSSLEEIVEKALSSDGINYLVLNSVRHTVSIEDNAYIIDVELNPDEKDYPYKITTKISPEQKILSQESKKLSKNEFVEAHLQGVLRDGQNRVFGYSALILLGSFLVLCLIAFFEEMLEKFKR